MRRLVLTADLSLDGFAGRDGLDPEWAREYDDDELVRYRRAWSSRPGSTRSSATGASTHRRPEGRRRYEELAPIVAEGGPEFCQELTRAVWSTSTASPSTRSSSGRATGSSPSPTASTDQHPVLQHGQPRHTWCRSTVPRPPTALPWAQGAGEHDHDPEPEEPAERPAPG